jgi:tetratricopeptide (TPR) repeat protein
LLDAAEHEVREGLEINPSPYSRSEDEFEALRTRGNIAFLQGRFADAVASLEEAHQVSAGPVSDWWLAQAYYYQGQKERAERLLEELMQSSSASAAARSQSILSGILAARGERLRARELVSSLESGAYMDHHVAYSLGQAYAQLGEREQAIIWIRKSAETGFPCYPWFERDRLLEPLRNDSNFQHFMAELKNNYETAKARYGS